MAESEEELKSLLMKVKVKVKSLSRVRLFVTPWTVAHQAPLSMGFSWHEYWSGLPLPSPGDISDPGIKPVSFVSYIGFFTTGATLEAWCMVGAQ